MPHRGRASLWGLRRQLLDLGAGLGLARPGVRLYEVMLAAKSARSVVVLYDGAPGTSLCSACHPPGDVYDQLGTEFELTAFRPSAEDGRHDMHLFRKPAGGGVAGGQRF